ncbi:MAG: gluconate 2-dehydrogenase subunit 3 family protein [Gemmatimonadetes bacterium]|nr:gluconate 2-dehydrogenase subunit 3 family protein [Gemmatimonadota bacterium]
MSEMSRRQALGVLASLPLAMALDRLETTPAAVERAAEAAQQALRLGEGEGERYQPRFFTPHEWRTVRTLVDLIIPRDERSGSATEAGVPEFMDFTMMDRPSMQTWMRGGLRWLDAESMERFGQLFAELAPAQQTAILDEIAWPARARPELSQGVHFFNRFRDLTASGFFSSRIGIQDLGYSGNTAVPEWKGCPEAALRHLGVSYRETASQYFGGR